MITGPLGVTVNKKCLIVNRAPDPLTDELAAKINEAVESAALPLGGIIPASDELVRQEISGKSYLELGDDSPIIRKAFAIFNTFISE